MSVVSFTDIQPGDLPRVGGKGLNLGLMLRAGLPVPEGFCLTANGAGDAGALQKEELLAAYQRLGAGLVAVRSSAAAEDGAEHSFAGQQETILGVRSEEHTSELQSLRHLVCRLLLEKKKKNKQTQTSYQQKPKIN